MTPVKNSIPRDLLWKYLGLTNEDKLRLTFINDQLFRITQPCQLNDPYEMKPRIIMGEYSTEDLKHARGKAVSSGVFQSGDPSDEEVVAFFLEPFPAKRMDKKSFPGLFPASMPELREEPFSTIAEYDEFRIRTLREDIERRINEEVGVLSLSEDPQSLLMWAHYAAEHRGICVGFDPSDELFRAGGDLKKMEYLDKRVSITSNSGVARIMGRQLGVESMPAYELLLRKHPDWAYEKEWRFISLLEHAVNYAGKVNLSSDVFLTRVPIEAIKAIIVGSRVTDLALSHLIKILDSDVRWESLEIFRSQLGEDNFDLLFTKVR